MNVNEASEAELCEVDGVVGKVVFVEREKGLYLDWENLKDRVRGVSESHLATFADVKQKDDLSFKSAKKITWDLPQPAEELFINDASLEELELSFPEIGRLIFSAREKKGPFRNFEELTERIAGECEQICSKLRPSINFSGSSRTIDLIDCPKTMTKEEFIEQELKEFAEARDFNEIMASGESTPLTDMWRKWRSSRETDIKPDREFNS